MSDTSASRFKSADVRRVFRRRYQHEYVLPSGRNSGIYAYPITDEEVEVLTSEYVPPKFIKTTDPTVLFGGYFLNESEWRLWTALRLKYGINYMNPQRRQFWLPGYKYEEPEAKKTEPADPIGEFGAWVSDLEDRVEALENRPIQKKEKKSSKKFKFDLTSEETTL